MLDLNELIFNTIDSMKTERNSKYTISSYSSTYNQLDEFAKNKKLHSDKFADTDILLYTEESFEELIIDFIKTLSNKYTSSRTINTKRTQIRTLCNFAYKTNIINYKLSDKIDYLKVDKGIEKITLSIEEIQNIENYLKSSIEDKSLSNFDRFLKVRNRFLFYCLLWTGARISEISNLTWDDIDVEKEFIKLYGKGGKTRTVPIKDDFLMHFYKYKDLEQKYKNAGIYRVLEDKYIFQSYFNHTIKDKSGSIISQDEPKALSTRALYNSIKEIFHLSGVRDAASPHTTRHTFASFSIKNGMSLPMVSDFLGHASVSITTNNYYHIISEKQKKDEMMKLSFK